jgi:hypothetical protein
VPEKHTSTREMLERALAQLGEDLHAEEVFIEATVTEPQLPARVVPLRPEVVGSTLPDH